MYTYKGKTALITGASSGIGAVFARMLAERGMNLILVARTGDKLRILADELAAKHGIRAETVSADLSRDGAAGDVAAAVARTGMQVDLLVNNAGFGTHDYFEAVPAERTHSETMLNVTAVVDMAHAFLPAMVARRDGAVINVASTAAFQPVPYMAVYGATKAFVLSFSEALWAEYQGRGVRVLALCPGATQTLFFGVAGEGAKVGNMETPEKVVATGLRALEQGRSYVISGTSNYLLAQVPRLSPRGLTARIARGMFKPRTAPAARD